jgi:hypothetical protein
MGARAARPRKALSISTVCMLKYGWPPADGGHPGGRRTGGCYTTDGHTCLRYGGREDAEGAQTRRQGRCISNSRYRMLIPRCTATISHLHLYVFFFFLGGVGNFLVPSAKCCPCDEHRAPALLGPSRPRQRFLS